ncbi:hypothetical protein HDG41_006483 [Paraburkholderia sp. JPY162]|uniref:Uncharacterized protein n=1 Tax=Paraburkholderia youngii TaxID=2782701 RepID=A0A7W8P8Q4_9BURK|nr:hypothetical protein [Paraburkholderia youngii]
MPGNAHDGHLMEEALDYAAILSDVQPEIVIVDRGCPGAPNRTALGSTTPVRAVASRERCAS